MSKRIVLMGEIVLLVVLVLGLAAIIMFKWGHGSFRAEDVQLEIIAPSEIGSGQEITYLIKYTNETRVNLEEAEMSFQEDEGLPALYQLGNIEPGQTDQIEIKASLVGQKGEVKLARATLRYIPANFSSYFAATAQASTLIGQAPLLISLDAPLTALKGQEIEYRFDYVNTSQEVLEDIKIEFSYPNSFSFKKAEPEPSEADNIWQIEKLESDKLGQIKVQGMLSGQPEEIKQVEVKAGYASTTAATQILASPLEISQVVPTLASPGEQLRYQIRYKNIDQRSLENVEISVQLEGEAFDFETLKIEQGSFDKYARKIFWNKAGVPELTILDADEQGEVNFSIKIQKKLSTSSQIKSTAEIRSKDIFAFDEKITKIKTRLTLNVKGYYAETTANIKNTGPVPPRVDETTTYTIHWQLTNLMNQCEDVSVVAILPDEVAWTAKTQVNAGELIYDVGEKQVVIWDVGKVPARTGFASPVYEAVFQLSLTPTSDQVGQYVTLINESTLSGRDAFAQIELTGTGKAITSQLPDDPTISQIEGIVVE